MMGLILAIVVGIFVVSVVTSLAVLVLIEQVDKWTTRRKLKKVGREYPL
jgi:hypothetical protein